MTGRDRNVRSPGIRAPLGRGRIVCLRRPREDDWPMFRRFVRENCSLHEPWVQPPDTPQAFRTFMINRNRSDRYERFLVLHVDDGRLIGTINLNEIVRGVTQTAYLAYYGSSAACGTGAMAEGLQLVMRHAFDRMKLHRLEAGIQPANERSIRYVKRAGFRFEGLAKKLIQIDGAWCDHERWAMLDEEWRAGRRAGAGSGQAGSI